MGEKIPLNSGEHKKMPSRELTYPTLGKGNSSSKCHFWGDMLVPCKVVETTTESIYGKCLKCFAFSVVSKPRHEVEKTTSPLTKALGNKRTSSKTIKKHFLDHVFRKCPTP